MVQTLDPISDVANAWGITGGFGTAWETLEDAADATYVDTTILGAECVVLVAPGDAPGASGLHRVHFRCTIRGVSVLPVLLDVELLQDTTVIASTVHTQPPPATPMQDNSFDLTPAEAATITDYEDLRILLRDAQSAGAVQHNVAEVYLELDDPPAAIADFVADVTSGPAPLSVDFTNLSDTAGGDGLLPDWTYLWDFGDAATSTDVHPTHVYATPGTYTVSLTVTAPGGNDTETKVDYIVVYIATGPFGERTAIQPGKRRPRVQAEGVPHE